MSRRRRILLLLCVTIIGLTPVAFFARYERFEEHLEEELGFSALDANAAKHAYAAGQVYGLLRTVLDADMAEDATLRLGVLTEYMETIVKISEPDSTREIMKDMYNNQAGIVAAEWALTQPATSVRDAVIVMARKGGLATSGYTLPVAAPPEAIEDYPQSVRDASFWFCEQQKAIKDVVWGALMEKGKK